MGLGREVGLSTNTIKKRRTIIFKEVEAISYLSLPPVVAQPLGSSLVCDLEISTVQYVICKKKDEIFNM